MVLLLAGMAAADVAAARAWQWRECHRRVSRRRVSRRRAYNDGATAAWQRWRGSWWHGSHLAARRAGASRSGRRVIRPCSMFGLAMITGTRHGVCLGYTPGSTVESGETATRYPTRRAYVPMAGRAPGLPRLGRGRGEIFIRSACPLAASLTDCVRPSLPASGNLPIPVAHTTPRHVTWMTLQ